MNTEELIKILSQEEGPKLDFKREYKISPTPPQNTIQQLWVGLVNGQWDELIKDVIALTNGNVGTAEQVGHLIIGAEDSLQSDGTRILQDMSHLHITTQQVLARVNTACTPPIPNIICEQVQVDGKNLYIISTPPSPYLHETNRLLTVVKGNFDNTGRLVSTTITKTYTEHTAFIRKGENISPASMNERRVLEVDKKFDLLIMNENIKFELINNLRKLLGKSKNGVYDSTLFYQSFKDNNKVELHRNLKVEGKYIERLVISIVGASRSDDDISTTFVKQAIESGRYLIYNVDNSRFERSKFLECLYLLQLNVKRFYQCASNSQINTFLAEHSGPGRRNEIHNVSFDSIIWVSVMLDRYQNIIQLSTALLAYILGNRTSLDKLNLNPPTPMADQAEQIEAETPTEEEIIEWVLNHELNIS